MPFFELSKILGLLINPINVICLLVFIATWLLWRERHVAAKRVLTLVTALMVVMTLLPIGDLLLWPLEQRFPSPNPWPAKVDGIIALGGSQQPLLTREHGQPAMNGHAERMTTFLAL